MAAAMLIRLRTAESLWLVTGHPQLTGNNKQYKTEMAADPE